MASIREVALPDHVIEILRHYRAEQARCRLSLGDRWEGDNDGYLFIQENGRQISVYTPYRRLQDIIDQYNETVPNECGRLPKIPLHGLRHTSATLLISLNVDVVTIPHRLGHSETSTTLNTYAQSLKGKDREAANVLGGLFVREA